MLYRKGSSYIVEGNIGGRILRYNNGNDLDDDNSTYVLALMALAKEKGTIPIYYGNHSYILWEPFLYIMGIVSWMDTYLGYVPWMDHCVADMMSHYFKYKFLHNYFQKVAFLSF
ncbi:GSCOCG00007248001-RA-CDS [Cotesia congregata]|nr:GSCOCG00007248001-RA-CDS [Cotesia congregata]